MIAETSTTAVEPEKVKPLSRILREMCDSPEDSFTVADLVARFGPRAFGAILFIFAVACTLPLPPGGTTLFGAPLVLLAPQVALGARTPWLPRRTRERQIAKTSLERVFKRIIPTLERIEAVSRPRLRVLFGPIGDRIIGVICSVLALVLILPIPLGNILPALAVSVLSLSLLQRDGVLAVVGYALAAASGGVLVIAFGIVVRTGQHILTALTGA
jgi:hypothetical protein